MSLQFSTEFKRRILGPESFGQIMGGGAIALYTGAPPASADLAPTGTLLGYVTNGALPWAAGSALNGLEYVPAGAYWLKSPGQIWQCEPIASGVAGWFRILPTAIDPGDTSILYPRIDGLINASGIGAQMRLLNPSLVVGDIVEINDFWYTILPINGA